jgi:hypothetical protein
LLVEEVQVIISQGRYSYGWQTIIALVLVDVADREKQIEVEEAVM